MSNATPESRDKETVIYLSHSTEKLRELKLDSYFPETYLHPRKIGELTPSLLGTSFCTHSEVILNKVGHLVYEGKADRLRIKVIRLILDDQTETWEEHISEYDESGYLTNWALGFLEMDHL